MRIVRPWRRRDDGVRQALATGEAAFFARGEMHSKGSETGLSALMVQVGELTPLYDDREGS